MNCMGNLPWFKINRPSWLFIFFWTIFFAPVTSCCVIPYLYLPLHPLFSDFAISWPFEKSLFIYCSCCMEVGFFSAKCVALSWFLLFATDCLSQTVGERFFGKSWPLEKSSQCIFSLGCFPILFWVLHHWDSVKTLCQSTLTRLIQKLQFTLNDCCDTANCTRLLQNMILGILAHLRVFIPDLSQQQLSFL